MNIDRDLQEENGQDYYGYFMTALFGLIDDAELSAYSAEGIEHLRRAREAFLKEFMSRHPSGFRKAGLAPD